MPSQSRIGTAKPKHRKRFCGHNERKRNIKKNCEGIHDRFLRDPVYRDSQLEIGWTEEKCIAMDKWAQEDHSHRLSYEEYLRYQKHWYITLNKSGKNAPMRLRSDFRAAVTEMNRLHRESGEERAEPFLFQQNKDGTLLPQVIPGGTGSRPIAGGAHEFNSFFKCVVVDFACN